MEKEIKEIQEEIKEIHKVALQNQQSTQTNANDIRESFKRIDQNTFVLDIIKDYKNEIDTLKDIVKTNKKTIKFMLIILAVMVTILAFICVHHFIIE